MPLPTPVIRASAACLVLLLAACQKAPATVAESAVPTTWPASLHVFGDGFPNPGDPCRRVGESAATADFLDHTAALVGCHAEADAAKLGGRTVATVDGITLVSVPQ
ncbi:MAG: hypothetical protein RL030_2538 [Pseudomonadota bacterium]|jgi:hypothetical protein